MKKLKLLLSIFPSYYKTSTDKVHVMSGISTTTIDKYKLTEEYKNLKKAYIMSKQPV